jgi:flagellar protein FliL
MLPLGRRLEPSQARVVVTPAPQLSQAGTCKRLCRARAKIESVEKSIGLQSNTRIGARQIHVRETNHPAKFSVSIDCGNVPLTIPNLTFPRRGASALAAIRMAAALRCAASQRGNAMAAKVKKSDAGEAEVETEEDEAGEAAPAKRTLPLKLILIAGAALLLLAGGGTAGYIVLGGGKDSKAAAAPIKPVTFVDVPEVLVNLSSPGADRVQYLKVKVVLELPDAAAQPQIQTAMPRVMDAFQTYLRELRPTDLDGSAALYRLKEELTRRVNAAISPNRINAVLFKEIVVQ